eukprot:TRINITY_DN15809_c0_g1_i1.p1 TRINITY_DN15809_c0_g1~~TRINITY_DN15809_c0_g1_i1.p1  ORF type:complete len:106 (+),score=27.60 TRINITY_DN15809_c0_g1_i1:88-405(+)
MHTIPSVPRAAVAMEEWVEKTVSVITNDGRHLLGKLKGYDQLVNVILEDTHERIYSTDAPVIEDPLGLHLLRGDDIAVIGLVDEDIDSKQNLAEIRAAPIANVVT